MIWIAVFVLLLVYIYTTVTSKLQTLQNKGIKCRKQVFFFGDFFKFFIGREPFAQVIKNVYDAFPDYRYSGMYNMVTPLLVIRDPDIIRNITVKDFDHFTDRISIRKDESEQLWSRNLLSLKGDKWREMRSTLSPAFTSSKMKGMFVLMSECATQFTNFFSNSEDEVQTLELKDAFTRFSNDVIATCAFGVKCDSLRYKDNEFYLMGKEATNFSGLLNSIRFAVLIGSPSLARLLGVTLFTKPVSTFFKDLVAETVKAREEKSIVRPDMIQLLVEARRGLLTYDEKEGTSKETGFATVDEFSVPRVPTGSKELTLNDMTAQALLFFFAGFDTISTLMCFVCYELAINSAIQERLQVEVDNTYRECNGKITYEALNCMKYLDMVLSETLRKWPAMVATDRCCVSNYTILPEVESDEAYTIRKGEYIFLPIYGIHRDPKHYANPEKFDPERFSDENKHKIKPFTYLPFGIGPRNCIGSRFALLEVKVVLVHLLTKFEIIPVKKTPVPLQLSNTGFSLNASCGFWMGLKKRHFSS